MPWLAVHIVVPTLLLFGYDVNAFVARLGAGAGRRRLMWALGILTTVAVVWQFRLLCFVCFVHPASPAERLIYNHTHPDVQIAVAEFNRLAHDTGLGAHMPYYLTGESAWPLYWYLREMDNSALLDNETIETTCRPVVIMDWYDAIGSENLRRCYYLRRLKVREWWEPPMLDIGKMAGIWRVCLPTARLDMNGQLELLKAQTEWGKLLHYLAYRQIWLDPNNKEYSNSANEFAFCTRRDLYERYMSPEAQQSRWLRRDIPTYPPRGDSPVRDNMLSVVSDVVPDVGDDTMTESVEGVPDTEDDTMTESVETAPAPDIDEGTTVPEAAADEPLDVENDFLQ